MIARNLTIADAGKVYDAFRSVAVARGQENAPDYGFYDYPLTQEDFKQRLVDGRFSIGVEDGKNRELVAYVLAYSFEQVQDMDTSHDAILTQVRADRKVVYLDQLYMKPGLPLHIAGRLIDAWETLLAPTNPGIVTAIPQSPWKNVPSTRFSISRGLRRAGTVKDGELELAVFTKPLWLPGREMRELDLRIAG